MGPVESLILLGIAVYGGIRFMLRPVRYQPLPDAPDKGADLDQSPRD